ncbi:hypothetical protein [Burkholderia stagnalis]|uniref:hypothetical protein n=1 Tax=Burkholderia stagnalis TaxID=1503054 RepID=UPI000A968A83|nr:hypothetical protein [Burkholderia stagnalis]
MVSVEIKSRCRGKFSVIDPFGDYSYDHPKEGSPFYIAPNVYQECKDLSDIIVLLWEGYIFSVNMFMLDGWESRESIVPGSDEDWSRLDDVINFVRHSLEFGRRIKFTDFDVDRAMLDESNLMDKIRYFSVVNLVFIDEVLRCIKNNEIDGNGLYISGLCYRIGRYRQEIIGIVYKGGSDIRRLLSMQGKKRADALHNKPGGSREKRSKLMSEWATGTYATRDECAEKAGRKLGMSFSTARKALRNTPDPS